MKRRDLLSTIAYNSGARWRQKALGNVDEWGMQDIDTLLLASMEELGELSQSVLEARAEDGDPDRIHEELADLGALMFQLRWALVENDELEGGVSE